MTPPQTSIAIATVGQHNASDMTGFQARYNYLAFHYQEFFIDGTPSCCDNEGEMDRQWATALANSFGSFVDTSMIYMYDGANTAIGTFNDIYNQILTDGKARIVSSSWGCAEETCYSDSSMNTNHAIFNSMIGQGYTLVDDADDKGAYSGCTTTKQVQYPASDSDFLAISATRLELNSSGQFVSETAWPANSAGCAHNGGGGGGGCSVKFAAPNYQLSPSNPNYFCGTANGFSSNFKTVPDVALNGDWFNSPQNVFFDGAWQGNGGTSIATPEMGGFFAVENSYLLRLGNICGSGSSACSPLGQAGLPLYKAAITHAAHGTNPFYDTTSGCTTNDIGPGFCAITGYDRATGWGTSNMLQLAWALSYWSMREATPPAVSIAGPPTNTYLNSGTLSWSLVDGGSPPSGVSGWTAKWDGDPGDPSAHATPGSGDTFYSGPASAAGSTSGSAPLASAGNGCHTLFVRGWDNIGDTAVSTYGPVCFDGTAPTITTAPKSVFKVGGQLTSAGIPVTTSWAASDTGGSGLASYNLQRKVDNGAFTNVSLGSPTATSITQTLAPGHSYQYQVRATDHANNTSAFVAFGAFKLNLVQENGAGVTYSAGWTRQALAGSSGGSVDFSTAAGKTAKFPLKAKEFAWVSTKATNRGIGSVKFDSTAAVNVDTKGSSTSAATIVFAKAFAFGQHTFVITNLGTSGRPRIDVDALVYMS